MWSFTILNKQNKWWWGSCVARFKKRIDNIDWGEGTEEDFLVLWALVVWKRMLIFGITRKLNWKKDSFFTSWGECVNSCCWLGCWEKKVVSFMWFLTEPGEKNQSSHLCSPELELISATVVIFKVLLLCKQVKNKKNPNFLSAQSVNGCGFTLNLTNVSLMLKGTVLVPPLFGTLA